MKIFSCLIFTKHSLDHVPHYPHLPPIVTRADILQQEVVQSDCRVDILWGKEAERGNCKGQWGQIAVEFPGERVGFTLGNLQSSLLGTSPLQLGSLNPAGIKCLSSEYPQRSSQLITGWIPHFLTVHAPASAGDGRRLV